MPARTHLLLTHVSPGDVQSAPELHVFVEQSLSTAQILKHRLFAHV